MLFLGPHFEEFKIDSNHDADLLSTTILQISCTYLFLQVLGRHPRSSTISHYSTDEKKSHRLGVASPQAGDGLFAGNRKVPQLWEGGNLCLHVGLSVAIARGVLHEA